MKHFFNSYFFSFSLMVFNILKSSYVSLIFKKYVTSYGVVLTLLSLTVSCIDDFDAVSKNFESIYVVDARITNKVERQQIFISRTFELATDTLRPEEKALVLLEADNGDSYRFVESKPGTYTSENVLQIRDDTKYQLKIITTNGNTIISNEEYLPSEMEIEQIKAKRVRNNSGLDGISIVIDTNVENSSTSFFRYEYEETYQIIAPDYNGRVWDEVDYDYFMTDDDGWEVTTKGTTEELRLCYGNASSSDFLLNTTGNLSNNSLKNFEVRFLSNQNYFIANRYSLLLKLYHHSIDANSFYKTLVDFSEYESIFSNTQTGLLEGNLKSINSDIPVIGYFELSSYNEKRIFFNYEDYFPDEPLPPFPINCNRTSKPALYPEGFHVTYINEVLEIDGTSNSPLMDGILAGLIGFYDFNTDYFSGSTEEDPERGPYLVKPLACVDCRALGTNKKPDFWVDKIDPE